MEDVLMSGQQDRTIYTADSDDDDEETPCDDVSSKAGSSRPNSAGTVTGQPGKKCKQVQCLIFVKLIYFFKLFSNFIFFKFPPLEVVSRCHDPQLQVGENYICLI